MRKDIRVKFLATLTMDIVNNTSRMVKLVENILQGNITIEAEEPVKPKSSDICNH